MWIFVTMNRNMPLFNTVHHLPTVLEKYWVLTGDDQLTLSAPHWGPQEAFTVSCSHQNTHTSTALAEPFC